MKQWIAVGVVTALGWIVYFSLNAVPVDKVAPTVIVPVQVKEDQIEVVGRYCIDGIRVVHYKVKRWSDRYEFYNYVQAHDGAITEFNINYGYC